MLIGMTAAIWFFVNDGPAVTNMVSTPANFMPASTPADTRAAAPEIPFIRALSPEIMAQAQPEKSASTSQPRKSRPQLRINPRYPYRNFHVVYPLPYDVEYPGPNGQRRCVNQYVRESRPSGTVIVPRMRCAWVVRR
jgi:hypothetical protein